MPCHAIRLAWHGAPVPRNCKRSAHLPACPPACRNEHYKATTYCSDLALLELNASAQHSRPIGGTLQPGEFDFQAGHPLTAVGFGYTQPPQ